MSPGVFPVPRAEFAIEEPWNLPSVCESVALVRSHDGGPPRLGSSLSAYYDDEFVTFLFRGEDDGVVATYRQHDDPLYKEDVVELFLSPRRAEEYYEIEVNPLVTVFDARIESPQGTRDSMTVDPSWNCDGLFAARRSLVGPGHTFETVVRIPFRSLAGGVRAGDTWRGNFFRIDRHPDGDEFVAWRPTFRDPPDFHVPKAFGLLRFLAP
ncbi:MAG TPA: carbohydrate-binding family 9-like protein [Thermoanaerobaculia bacterium]|nr:carbohydrate-binding family 9-like protein [Thermoanaerobaculia bacterium]